MNEREIALLKAEVERLRKKLEIETKAKNKAYYFILKCDHFAEFVCFMDTYKSEDSHKDCLYLLSEGIE